jgi:hypothetical protein
MQYIVKKQNKKGGGNSKITKYFGGSRKNSKYKVIDGAHLMKSDSNKSKKKYSSNPNDLRRKTNSVEPPSHDLRMVASPGGNIKFQRHNKSVNNPKNSNVVASNKHKTKHYVMSQGNNELKKTLENAKRKGNGLRSLHRSDINSLEHDDSREYEIVK